MENTADTPFYKCMRVGLLGHTYKQKTRIPLPKVSKRRLMPRLKKGGESAWLCPSLLTGHHIQVQACPLNLATGVYTPSCLLGDLEIVLF